MKKVLFLWAFILGMFTHANAQQTFTNPIVSQDAADPSVILADDGYYYMYCSESYSGEGMPVWRSADMVNWTKLTTIFAQRPANVSYTFLWSPEVVKIGNKYNLYYSNADYGNQANTQICVATSDNPWGPFENNKILLRAKDTNYGAKNANVNNCIDPSFFKDDDGTQYLIWGSLNGLYYWQLDDAGTALTGNKSQVANTGVLSGDWKSLEAPSVVKRNGYYYIIASKGTTVGQDNASKITYELVVFRGEKLGGRFKNSSNEDVFYLGRNCPDLLKGNDYVLGPGHCSQIVTDNNGTDWIFYHGYSKKSDGTWDYPGARKLFASKVVWNNKPADWLPDGWPGILPPSSDPIEMPAVTAESIEYTRNVTSGNFGTICLPYASTSYEGAKFYNVAGTRHNANGELVSLVLEEVEGNVEAGKPYIFRATDSTLKVVYNLGIVCTELYPTATGLVGNLSVNSLDVPTGEYVISQNKFYRTTETGRATISQYKAYITLEGVGEYHSSSTKVVVFGLDGTITDDTTTGISEIENKGSNVYFNVAGQRVGHNAKGLVIKNGKKTIIK